MKPIYLALAVLGIVASSSPAGAGAATPFDVVIENGHIIDGTGSPWYAADVGIRDGRIAAIGHLGGEAATRRLDARGKIVAPGFIDMLGQSELTILVNPHLPSKIFQGITTEITGDGGSAAPHRGVRAVADASCGCVIRGVQPEWRVRFEGFRRPQRSAAAPGCPQQEGRGSPLSAFAGCSSVPRWARW